MVSASSFLAGARVIELGAGTGLVGMVASVLGKVPLVFCMLDMVLIYCTPSVPQWAPLICFALETPLIRLFAVIDLCRVITPSSKERDFFYYYYYYLHVVVSGPLAVFLLRLVLETHLSLPNTLSLD